MQYYKYYKAQFMTLTAVLIVGALIALYFTITGMFYVDTSQYIPEYALLVKNIKEKFLEIASLSKDCEEFKYNTEEFAKTLEKLRDFGYFVTIDIRVSPCNQPFQQFPSTSEAELVFSDGKIYYKELIVFSWRPRAS
ncbi:MAG: hypothetical protein QXS69_00500 [Candidatus Aenigmatarchaeota archaeon]